LTTPLLYINQSYLTIAKLDDLQRRETCKCVCMCLTTSVCAGPHNTHTTSWGEVMYVSPS